jgi:hypothetical protein
MIWTKKLVIVSVLAFSFLLAAVSGASLSIQAASGANGGCSNTPRSGDLVASWAWGYGSLAEMKNTADAVIDGVVVGSSTSVGGHDCGLIYTTYTIGVGTRIKGHVQGSFIKVLQTGGIIGSSKQEVTDDPLMQTGDRVILFLHLDSQSGIYGILGGPQGRLVVKNQLVYSLNALYSDRKIISVNWTINGLPETAILS